MTIMSNDATCPICGGRDHEAIIHIPDVPLMCNRLFDTAREAAKAPTGDIDLVQCQTCSHIHNAAFNPDRLSYVEGYVNSLHHSPTFAGFAEQLVRDLVDGHDLRHAIVVEIGCGDGRFLQTLCEVGQCRGYGFDPSQPKSEWMGTNGASVQIASRLFSPEKSDLVPKLLCCRHVLEHLAEPIQLLNSLNEARLSRAGTVFYFEVPNGHFVTRPQGLWDHIYEHHSCFTPASLAYLFRSKHFRLLKIGTTYSDQFLWVQARLGEDPGAVVPEAPDRQEATRIRQGYQNLLLQWRDRLANLKSGGKSVAVWGAGSKGVTFVNLVDSTEAICAVIDINPQKCGRYIPGTRHKVLAPKDLCEVAPDVLVVMNPIYMEEIADSVRELGLEPQFVTPV
jgi:SAM-dependent methyltransferase